MKACKKLCKIDTQRNQCTECHRTIEEIKEARKMDICDGISIEPPLTTAQYEKYKQKY